jgi:hypothetical protein
MCFGMSRKDFAEWGTVSVGREAVGLRVRPTATDSEDEERHLDQMEKH